MALQYDFGKDISSTSWPYLLGQAETLLYNLASKREEAPNRPIIFICYSFGSIILKKVSLFQPETQAVMLTTSRLFAWQK
jgi:hypothetical protein